MKYLVIVNYNAEGMKGVLAKGGSARREVATKLATDVGGTLESFYFAFGTDDAYVVLDLPDNVSAAAIGMAVGAGGGASARTVVLLTPEEIDEAATKKPQYTPPGG